MAACASPASPEEYRFTPHQPPTPGRTSQRPQTASARRTVAVSSAAPTYLYPAAERRAAPAERAAERAARAPQRPQSGAGPARGGGRPEVIVSVQQHAIAITMCGSQDAHMVRLRQFLREHREQLLEDCLQEPQEPLFPPATLLPLRDADADALTEASPAPAEATATATAALATAEAPTAAGRLEAMCADRASHTPRAMRLQAAAESCGDHARGGVTAAMQSLLHKRLERRQGKRLLGAGLGRPRAAGAKPPLSSPASSPPSGRPSRPGRPASGQAQQQKVQKEEERTQRSPADVHYVEAPAVPRASSTSDGIDAEGELHGLKVATAAAENHKAIEKAADVLFKVRQRFMNQPDVLAHAAEHIEGAKKLMSLRSSNARSFLGISQQRSEDRGDHFCGDDSMKGGATLNSSNAAIERQVSSGSRSAASAAVGRMASTVSSATEGGGSRFERRCRKLAEFEKARVAKGFLRGSGLADAYSTNRDRARESIHVEVDQVERQYEYILLARSLNLAVDDLIAAKHSFDVMDGDASGTLNYQEFQTAMVSVLEQQHGEGCSEEVRMACSDHWERCNKSVTEGEMEFPEFLAWYAKNRFLSNFLLNPAERRLRDLAQKYTIKFEEVENIKRHFDKEDTDGSGEISENEFAGVLHRILKVPNGERVAGIRMFWMQIDGDKSGSVSFEEFLQWWTKNRDQILPYEDFYWQLRPGVKGTRRPVGHTTVERCD